jgi:hypothetical protein
MDVGIARLINLIKLKILAIGLMAAVGGGVVDDHNLVVGVVLGK